MGLLLFFSLTKVPEKSDVTKEVFILAHFLRVQSVIMRKSWRQEPEAGTGDRCIASIVGKQRHMDISAHPIPSLT